MAERLRRFGIALLALALGACALAPVGERGPADGSADLLADIFTVVETTYVVAPDFPAIRLGALRALEKALPAGSFEVSPGADETTVGYRIPGRAPERAVYTGRSKTEVLHDVTAAAELARQIAPGLDREAAAQLLIKGALASLDPHSVWLDREAYAELQAETSGSFVGVGVEIAVRQDQLTVVAPIEGTPAARAGLRPGDRIVQIAGAPTAGITVIEAIRRLRGPKGTTVTIAVLRDGLSEPQEVSLTREIVAMRSVRIQEIEPGFGYVRIRQFQERTVRDLQAGLDALEKGRPLAGLVLDLRNNPGGLVSAAVGVAEQLLADGKLIVSTEGRAANQNLRFVAHGVRPRTAVPLAILVNRGSASASEIVAAALQDHGRAVVVGQASFGKGTVQTIIPLSDGSALRLTTAQYFTPSGRSLHGTGVQPAVAVEEPGPDGAGPSREDAGRQRQDVTLQRALAHVRMLAGAPAPAASAPGGGPSR